MATSIAEEGLDIMEVDLVICFDANISPLRMIQRMGRTGRKRDGRVDILSLALKVEIVYFFSSLDLNVNLNFAVFVVVSSLAGNMRELFLFSIVSP